MAKVFALARRHSAIGQRQLDILENREIADEIEALEDEADLAIPNPRALRKREVRDLAALERIAAVRSAYRAGRGWKGASIFRSPRAGDGDVFARADVEMDAGERVRFDFIGEEDFGDAVEVDQGVVAVVHVCVSEVGG